MKILRAPMETCPILLSAAAVISRLYSAVDYMQKNTVNFFREKVRVNKEMSLFNVILEFKKINNIKNKLQLHQLFK